MREIIKGVLVFIGCLLILNGMAHYYESKKVNMQKIKTYQESQFENTREKEVLDVLRTANEVERKIEKEESQVIGVLKIPSIHIEYPIMQGEDNEYYLTHDPEGNVSIYGSIFWDYKDRPLIFGHNMRDGAMFGKLKQLQLEDNVYIDKTSYKVIKKKVLDPYSVMEISTLALVTCQGEDRLVVYLEENKED